MAREIWLSPLLGSNRSQLTSRCADLVSSGKPHTFLYLAASHPLLELVTDQIFAKAQTPGVWGELPVYLFRGFVRRVLLSAVESGNNLSLAPRTPVDREELPLKRSLISQILKRLAASDQLTALKPLANRDGCVNTLATLVGEIQRAGKTPDALNEIVRQRMQDFPAAASDQNAHVQTDFDRDVARVYSAYSEILNTHNLSEADGDQLRALAVIHGQLDGQTVKIPWLEEVDLLVLDGFFDFTPVQGEMLKHIIRSIPNVIVNLNGDEANPTIFEPFNNTLEQLQGIADFKIQYTDGVDVVNGSLSSLRQRLFKPVESAAGEPEATVAQSNIRLFTCADRETELRKIAKEIKRLVHKESYSLQEIALVVRERASYAETIIRVMSDESIPCNLERRINASDIPSVRAARKLFELLDAVGRNEKADVQTPEIADLIKSEYFRLSETEVEKLSQLFDQKYGAMFAAEISSNGDDAATKLSNIKYSLGIGRWDPDTLENAVAFVGGALSLHSWLERAKRLLSNWTQVSATTDFVAAETAEGADEESDQIEDADKVATDDRGVEKKRRPSREVHPASIAWTSLVLDRFGELVKSVPQAGEPRELRARLMWLLEQLQFSTQIRKPARRALEDTQLPHVMLDVRGLEALRRAFLVALKSIEVTSTLSAEANPQTKLGVFLDEVARGLNVEVSFGKSTDRGGLRVLEATDVRGLKFRAIFVAGLVEGGFPLRASRDWIYPHEERERLKRDYDLTLEDISPATLLKEEHYFYQTACRATEKLFLSRPLLLDDGAETVPSYYVNELARAVLPYKIEHEPIRRDLDGAEIFDASTAAELATSIVRQDERQRHLAGRDHLLPSTEINALKNRAAQHGHLPAVVTRRIDIERERAGNRFGAYDGQITTPELLAMLRQRFGDDYVHSASGLSTYGNCAYRFFANRLLRLEPRGEAALDLQAIDAGKLLHDVLRRFFERHRGERLTDADRDSLRVELRAVADRVFHEHEVAVPPLNPDIWKIDCEIRKIILDQVLLYELGFQKQTRADVRSRYFEVAFGMTPRQAADPASKLDQLELRRSTVTGEEVIRIQGQIDRVDEADDGTLIAYDYKLSTGADAEDMKAGRSLQLPIYLEALERLILPGRTIAGGGYYILKAKPGRRNSGIYRKDFGDYLGLHARNSILTDADWEQVRSEVVRKVWQFFDGMRGGDFRVRPSQSTKTCRFCDYSAVCRYEKYRMRWKEGS